MKKLIMMCVVSCCVVMSSFADDSLDKQCVPEGQWVSKAGKRIDNQSILKELSQANVVLIGEDHENPEHHRMQLHTIAQLYSN